MPSVLRWLDTGPRASPSSSETCPICAFTEEGYLYDSSIFPVYHDRYGIPGWERFPKRVDSEEFSIYEFPPSTYRVCGCNLPFGGGGYLRLLPAQLLSYCIGKINDVERKPAILYFNTGEIDQSQPRIKSSLVKSFRHYNDIGSTERKVAYLLNKFTFRPMCELMEMTAVEVRQEVLIPCFTQ